LVRHAADPRWTARKLARVGVAALITNYAVAEDRDLRLVGDGLRL
jgi:hypothetical protein